MNLLKEAYYSLFKKERIVLLVLVLIFSFTGIARIVSAIDANSELIPIEGGIYREGVIGQPVSINPVFWENQVDRDASALIFATLSDLISGYHTEENGMVYILNLKEDLFWDDEKPLTSDDVIFTINTIKNSNSISPGVWDGTKIERISELQIKITLPRPVAFFEETMKNFRVIPRHIFGNIPPANAHLSLYNLEPVGNGPYKFSELLIKKNGFITELRLERNEFFSGKRPYINEFVFKFYENEEDIEQALRTREIDGFGTATPSLSKIFQSSQTNTTFIPMPRSYGVFFNTTSNKTLENGRVRAALLLSVNKEDLMKEIEKEHPSAINGPFVKIGETPDPELYDPELAKELILKSGEENAILRISVPDIPFLEETAEFLKKTWEEIGLQEVKIVKLSPEKIMKEVIPANNYELLLFGETLEHPEDIFPFWHSRERAYPGLNLSLYKNQKADILMEDIRETTNIEKREKLISELETIIVDDVPAVFLFSLPYTYIYNKNLEGFYFENENEFITLPSERFKNISMWYTNKARALK